MSEPEDPRERRARRSEIKRTRLAQQGLDFATLFTAKYLDTELNGYIPKMREPAGVSTEGGKQAVQHIVLEPKSAGDAVITMGHANVATKTAKLRTYDCLESMHALRFRGRPFVIAHSTFQPFFDDLLSFMRKQGMQVDIETRPPETAGASLRPGAPRSGGKGAVWVAIVLSLLVGVVVGYLIYTGRLF